MRKQVMIKYGKRSSTVAQWIKQLPATPASQMGTGSRPDAPLLIQLVVNAPGKVEKDNQVFGLLQRQ